MDKLPIINRCMFSINANGDNVRKLSNYTGTRKAPANPLKLGLDIFYEDYGISKKRVVNEKITG